MAYREFRNLSALGFRSKHHCYVYDRFSNEILRVEPVVFDVLDDSFELHKKQIVEKYAAKYSKRSILQALGSIVEIQQTKKALLNFRIPRFSISQQGHELDHLTQKLNNHLTQLTLNVTEDCNLRCEYCVYSGNYINRRQHNKSNDITLSLAKKAVDFFCAHSRKSKERYISLYGGEPFLRFGFVKEIIEYGKQMDPNINFAITSNGTLLNKEIVRFLDNNNVALTVSIDGPKELHDTYRVYPNRKGTFDSIIGKIKMIKETFPEFYSTKLKVNSVIVPYDGDIEEINRFFNHPLFSFTKNPQKYALGLVNPQENLFMAKHDYNNYVRKYYAVMFKQFLNSHIQSGDLSDITLAKALLVKQIKMLYFRSNQRLSKYSFYWPNGICIPGMRSLFVSATGKFYPCEKLYDYDEMVIGDIKSGFDVGRIAKLIDEYCDSTIRDCEKCWAYRLCGECFLTIREKNSWDTKKRKDFCVGQKSVWKCILTVYVSILEKNSDAFNYFVDEGRSEPRYVKEMIQL